MIVPPEIVRQINAGRVVPGGDANYWGYGRKSYGGTISGRRILEEVGGRTLAQPTGRGYL